MFFEKEMNVTTIANFIKFGRAANIKKSIIGQRLSISIEILSEILRNPKTWDRKCQFNIEYIGDQFINLLGNFNPNNFTESSLGDIYTHCYRFLCEYDLKSKYGEEPNQRLNEARTNIQNDMVGNDDVDTRSQLVYASYIMPAHIVNEYLSSPEIELFKNFNSQIEKVHDLKEKWDNEINGKLAIVENLRDKLENYKTAFNFVGLNQGFSNLLIDKNKEVFWLSGYLIAMGVLILLPPVIGISNLFLDPPQKILIVSNNLIEQIAALVSFLSLEVILLYFFRIILHRHRSVRTQIMQLELRKTLCEFIQNYASYSSEIKQQDNGALEKFENLIFSGIISEPGKLPSTYDGIDQITSLISKMKSSSG